MTRVPKPKTTASLTLAVLTLMGFDWCQARDFRVCGFHGADIQRSIDSAAAAGGGRVVVAPGEYRSGSLRLRSRVELHLEKGARVVGGSRSDEYYSFPSEICAIRPENSSKVFVFAWEESDIAITGEGVIDGMGLEFFDRSDLSFGGGRFFAKPPCERPRMLQFVRCDGVRIQGATFLNSPCWTMLLRQCSNVCLEDVVVDADQRIINSDGLDIDGCKNVRVVNSRFKTGDDCLIVRAIREPGNESRIVCEDVVVSNCTFDSACQVVRMGCPSDDVIRNVRFFCIRGRGYNGINFDYPKKYLDRGDGGRMDISDVVFDGFDGEFSGCALRIVVENGVKIRRVGDILFRGFNVRTALPVTISGQDGSWLENVRCEGCVVNGKPLKDGNLQVEEQQVK